MQHPLDEALALQPIGEGRYRAHTHDAYWNFAGPFGGYIAALLMKAVLSDERLLGPPVAQTVNFCAPLAKGLFEVILILQRSGKATQHWSVELKQAGIVAATGSVVCANRRDTFKHTAARIPDVPAPAGLPSLRPPRHLPWFSAYDFRFVEGGPGFGLPPQPVGDLDGSRTVLWLKDVPDRPLDYPALAALSDCFILRLVQMRRTMPPMSTVSMTTYFYAMPDELVVQGTQHLLGVADASRFNANFHDQTMQLWGANDTLLATGTQTVWYRE